MKSKHGSAHEWVKSLSATAKAAISERDIVALDKALGDDIENAEYNVVVALGDLSKDQAVVLWDIARSANDARRLSCTDGVKARTSAELMVKLSSMRDISRAIEDSANEALRDEARARKLREEDGLEMAKPPTKDLWDVGPNSK